MTSPESPESPFCISGPVQKVHHPLGVDFVDYLNRKHTKAMKEPISAAELIPAVVADLAEQVARQPDAPTRILLSEAASRHLAATGEKCFVVIDRASYPDDPKRWIIYLVPCSIAQADAAVRVAMGQSTERRKRSD